MRRRINNGSSNLLSQGRPYVLAIWLGFFVAGVLIPNGYMSSMAQDGSVPFILCSATGSSSPSDATVHDSNDICSFAMFHGSGIQSGEMNPPNVRSIGRQHSALNHGATTTSIYGHLARAPPTVS